jgi:hypothetical protein
LPKRPGFERLFRAIELMYRPGGYQTGKTFRMDRGQLIAPLSWL